MATTKITNPELFDLASLDSALQLPSGTTAERPTSPSTGEWRYNTDDNKIEFYDGADWLTLQDEEIPPVPSENFSIVTYTGNGGTQSITGVGFQPDFVWVKDTVQTGEWHMLSDSSRGTNSQIFSNAQNAQDTKSTVITSFDSDGFSVGSDALVNANTREYVAWCWKANGGTTSSNTDGTITSTVQANTKTGFSIVTYSGNASGGATIGHGLLQAPEMIIFKRLDGVTDWHSYHHNVSSASNCLLYFNTQAAPGCSTGFLNNTAPSSSVITLGTSVGTNGSSMIAYCFHSVAGYSKVGSYTGSSTNDYASVFVSTGFKPAYVMIKQTNTGGADWLIFDNTRANGGFLGEFQLNNNTANAEYKNTSNPAYVLFTEDGFEVNGNSQSINGNGASYVYIAFAADPTTTSPTLSDSFNIVTYNGDSSTYKDITGYGFAPTLVWVKNRNSGNWNTWKDRIRSSHVKSFLSSNLSDASQGSGPNDAISEFLTDGWQASSNWNGSSAGLTNQSGLTYVGWGWKANNDSATRDTSGTIPAIISANQAAGFSIVKYTGNGTNSQTLPHGLGAKPDFVVIKQRNAVSQWVGFTDATGTFSFFYLNTTQALTAYPSMSYDATYLNLNSGGDQNGSGDQHVAYFFRSIAGFSDFGSYSGTGVNGNNITVGFQPNWLMVKRTNAADNWVIVDSERGTNNSLFADSASNELSNSGAVTFTSTGFTVNGASGGWNNASSTYLYIAFKTN